MAWTTLGTVAPGDVLRANSGTAAYNNVIGNLVAGHPLVSTLPGSPADGDTIYYQTTAMATAGVVWTLRYRSGGGTYKWEFTGGPSLSNVALGANVTATTNTHATKTGGPSLTIPLAGEYVIAWGALVGASVSAAYAGILPFYNGTAVGTASDLELAQGTTVFVSVATQTNVTFATAGNTLDLRYRVDSGTGTFGRRFLYATPVRVG